MGLVALWLLGYDLHGWNVVWALTGVSFVFAFVPLPGITSALLIPLRHDWFLGGLGVLGAAVGSTLAAGLLLALGHTGRAYLRKRANKSARARKMLAWSHKFAKKWTYAAVVVLLIPQFIPRAIVLDAAVLARLRSLPFLVSVFVGTFLRNLLILVAFSLIK